MGDTWTDFKNGFRRLSSNAKAAMEDTASELREKGVSGVVREAVTDTASAMEEFASSASTTLSDAATETKKGLDSTATWLMGGPATPASSSTASAPRSSQGKPGGQRLPAAPPPPAPPPRLEDLRKGDKVYRKLQPAEIVKVDYEVDPPSLVVRMLDDGREVGTTGAHVTLGSEMSQRCLQRGVRVCMVNLQARPDLNGARGTL